MPPTIASSSTARGTRCRSRRRAGRSSSSRAAIPACSPWRRRCSRRSRPASRRGARSTSGSSPASPPCWRRRPRSARRWAAISAPSRCRTISRPGATVERRLKAAAEGDFVIALYNPASKARPHQLGQAFDLLRTLKSADTPVLFVRAAGTAEAKVDHDDARRGRSVAGRHAHPGDRRRQHDAAGRALGLHAAQRAGRALMSEPRHRFLGAPHDMAGRLDGPRDHDDRQAELARRLDLGDRWRCRRSSWRRSRRSCAPSSRRSSASRSNGPRCCSRTRLGGSARLLRRVDECGRCSGAAALAAKACSSCRPRLRNTRRGVLPMASGRGLGGRARSASCRRLQAARRDARARRAARRRCAQAATALAEMRGGIGMRGVDHRLDLLLAQEVARGRRRRRSRRCAWRAAAAWASAVRPASDRVASKRGSPASSSASAEASVVPPRMRTRMRDWP